MNTEEKQRLAEINSRLEGVKGKEWVFDPHHDMFVGETNMLVMYDRHVDLGRNAVEWHPDGIGEDGKVKYKMPKWCEDHNTKTEALGRFLEQCREDMAYLLERVKEQSA